MVRTTGISSRAYSCQFSRILCPSVFPLRWDRAAEPAAEAQEKKPAAKKTTAKAAAKKPAARKPAAKAAAKKEPAKKPAAKKAAAKKTAGE